MLQVGTYLTVLALLCLSFGCAAPPHAADKPAGEHTQTPQAEPAEDPTLSLVDLRFTDTNRNTPILFVARPVYNGPGHIVGIAGRITAFIRGDGEELPVDGSWRLLDSDELGYGRATPTIDRCLLLHPGPRPAFTGIRLRVLAAVAERIERVSIASFQPGQDQRASAHGITLSIQSKLGTALGRSPATIIRHTLASEQAVSPAENLAVWGLSEADRAAVNNSKMRINYRLGFVNDEQALDMPSGQASGYIFLGKAYTGRTFAANVPIGIQLIEADIVVRRP